MIINELHMPLLADKLDINVKRSPFVFYYLSFNLLNLWIKRNRKGQFCLCSSGYKKKVHSLRPVEVFPTYDVLFVSDDLDIVIDEFKKFINDELFFKLQGDLF